MNHYLIKQIKEEIRQKKIERIRIKHSNIINFNNISHVIYNTADTYIKNNINDIITIIKYYASKGLSESFYPITDQDINKFYESKVGSYDIDTLISIICIKLENSVFLKEFEINYSFFTKGLVISAI